MCSSRNPLGPAYRDLPMPPRARGAPPPLHFVRSGRRRIALSARRGDGSSASTTRRRGIACSSSDYALANRLVTNAEFLDFIATGGYRDPKLWLADGWAKIRELGWNRPLCWSEDNGARIHARRLAPDRSARTGLPRELLRGRRVRALGRRPAAHRGRMGARRRANARRGQPARRRLPAPARAARGEPATCQQLWGDVWEWCPRAMAPTPAPSRSRARSASTTASSCATSSWSAAARAHMGGPSAADVSQLLLSARSLAIFGIQAR